jgi:acyl-CoA dehydrogenase
MSVLNVERPDFMAEEDIRMFEATVIKFFDQHAPAERTEKWRKEKVVERAMWTKPACWGCRRQKNMAAWAATIGTR